MPMPKNPVSVLKTGMRISVVGGGMYFIFQDKLYHCTYDHKTGKYILNKEPIVESIKRKVCKIGGTLEVLYAVTVEIAKKDSKYETEKLSIDVLWRSFHPIESVFNAVMDDFLVPEKIAV